MNLKELEVVIKKEATKPKKAQTIPLTPEEIERLSFLDIHGIKKEDVEWGDGDTLDNEQAWDMAMSYLAKAKTVLAYYSDPVTTGQLEDVDRVRMGFLSLNIDDFLRRMETDVVIDPDAPDEIDDEFDDDEAEFCCS